MERCVLLRRRAVDRQTSLRRPGRLRFRQWRGAQIRRAKRNRLSEVSGEGPGGTFVARRAAGRKPPRRDGERCRNPLDARGPGSARNRSGARRTQSEDGVARRLCGTNAEIVAGRGGGGPPFTAAVEHSFSFDARSGQPATVGGKARQTGFCRVYRVSLLQRQRGALARYRGHGLFAGRRGSRVAIQQRLGNGRRRLERIAGRAAEGLSRDEKRLARTFSTLWPHDSACIVPGVWLLFGNLKVSATSGRRCRVIQRPQCKV